MRCYDVIKLKNNRFKAADVAAMAGAAVQQEEQSNLNSLKSNLGQYTGATLEGGTARLDKFARYFLKIYSIYSDYWSRIIMTVVYSSAENRPKVIHFLASED